MDSAVSPCMTSACARSLTIVANACSSASNPRASTGTSVNPSARAVSRIDASRLRLSATSGLNRMPRRERFGSVSFSNSNRLPRISLPVSPANPVTFPPGKPGTDRIDTADHDDRDGRGRLHGRNRNRIEPGDDDVHAEPDQFCSKRRQSFHLAVGEAVFNDDTLANAVAEAPQALFERLDGTELLLPGGDPEVPHPVDNNSVQSRR